MTATANPDGTVTVKWPAANGLGRKIIRYTVTSISNGDPGPGWRRCEARHDDLRWLAPYGDQVAFTVVAVNDKGAGSDPSPVSNTVVPFTTPGAPAQRRRPPQ